MTTAKPTEPIYDERISPLMTQVLAICKEHKIPMIASFGLTSDDAEYEDDDGRLMCTSALLADDYDPPDNLRRAYRELRSSGVTAFAITTVAPPKETP